MYYKKKMPTIEIPAETTKEQLAKSFLSFDITLPEGREMPPINEIIRNLDIKFIKKRKVNKVRMTKSEYNRRYYETHTKEVNELNKKNYRIRQSKKPPRVVKPKLTQKEEIVNLKNQLEEAENKIKLLNKNL